MVSLVSVCACACAHDRVSNTHSKQNQQIEFDKIWIVKKYESQVAQIFAHRIFFEYIETSVRACARVCVYVSECASVYVWERQRKNDYANKWSLHTNSHTARTCKPKKLYFFHFREFFFYILLFFLLSCTLASMLSLYHIDFVLFPFNFTAYFLLFIHLFFSLPCFSFLSDFTLHEI